MVKQMSEKPLVYLILGVAGSGRREVVADLLEGGLGAGERALVLLSDGERAADRDARLDDRGDGGARAGGSFQRPQCLSILLMTSAWSFFSINAIIFIVPPHFGHSRGSTSKTLRIKAAHLAFALRRCGVSSSLMTTSGDGGAADAAASLALSPRLRFEYQP